MEQVRAPTTSRNAALRFALVGLALLVVNEWIQLHWQFLPVAGRGPRHVARQTFRLDRMARFLTPAMERYYGVVTADDPHTTEIGDLLSLSLSTDIGVRVA